MLETTWTCTCIYVHVINIMQPTNQHHYQSCKVWLLATFVPLSHACELVSPAQPPFLVYGHLVCQIHIILFLTVHFFSIIIWNWKMYLPIIKYIKYVWHTCCIIDKEATALLQQWYQDNESRYKIVHGWMTWYALWQPPIWPTLVFLQLHLNSWLITVCGELEISYEKRANNGTNFKFPSTIVHV